MAPSDSRRCDSAVCNAATLVTTVARNAISSNVTFSSRSMCVRRGYMTVANSPVSVQAFVAGANRRSLSCSGERNARRVCGVLSNAHATVTER